MYNSKIFVSLFLISIFANVLKAFSDEEINSLTEEFTNLASSIDDLYVDIVPLIPAKLKDTPLFKENLREFKGMYGGQSNMLAFNCKYEVRPESIPEVSPLPVPDVFVTLYMFSDENALQNRIEIAKKKSELSGSRWPTGNDNKHGYYFVHNTKAKDGLKIGENDVVSFVSAQHGMPYTAGIQIMYEFGVFPIEINENTIYIGVEVMESFGKFLNKPLSELEGGAYAENYLMTLLSITEIGESLNGQEILYGNLTLDTLGYRIVQRRFNNRDYNFLSAFVLLYDNFVDLKENVKNSEDYQANYKMFADEYRAPWINSQNQTPVTYSYDMREDGYSLLITMQKFMELNEKNDDVAYNKFLELLNNKDERATCPTGKSAHAYFETILKKFYNGTLTRILV